MDYVKRNSRLKMSATEVIFFVRYFSIMVGHLVPHDNEVQELYLHLRNIVSIIYSPNSTWDDLILLDSLITEHHQLYLKSGND